MTGYVPGLLPECARQSVPPAGFAVPPVAPIGWYPVSFVTAPIDALVQERNQAIRQYVEKVAAAERRQETMRVFPSGAIWAETAYGVDVYMPSWWRWLDELPPGAPSVRYALGSRPAWEMAELVSEEPSAVYEHRAPMAPGGRCTHERDVAYNLAVGGGVPGKRGFVVHIDDETECDGDLVMHGRVGWR